MVNISKDRGHWIAAGAALMGVPGALGVLLAASTSSYSAQRLALVAFAFLLALGGLWAVLSALFGTWPYSAVTKKASADPTNKLAPFDPNQRDEFGIPRGLSDPALKRQARLEVMKEEERARRRAGKPRPGG